MTQFKATNLTIENVLARITINPHDSNLIEVDITGYAPIVNNITTTQNNDTVIIKGKVENYQNINITNGRLIINGNPIESIPQVNVFVPYHAILNVSNSILETNIGAVNGILNLIVKSVGNVNVESISGGNIQVHAPGNVVLKESQGDSLAITINSTGNVHIKHINQSELKVITKSVGSITINSGFIKSLEAMSMSIGNINCGATVHEIKSVTTTTMGNINVLHVEIRPDYSVIHQNGMGRISIG